MNRERPKSVSLTNGVGRRDGEEDDDDEEAAKGRVVKRMSVY
jgi:hypothetical protein